ncbi:MAG: WecB/TagA/CpsF family glycosyltransferase [Pseudomonadota bacterium]
MRQLHEAADLVYFDGTPLIFWARLLGMPVSIRNHVTFLDYWKQMFALAEASSWRVFYLGGKPGVADRAAKKLATSYPNLMLKYHHGYLATAADNERVIAQIREFQPQFVLVGMGMPIQEEWILRNHRHFSSTALIAVGAAFDYLAGELKTPNRWLKTIGIEWVYRLCCEPRRLSFRYLVEPWFLIPHATRDLMSHGLSLASKRPSSSGSAK